MAKEGVLQGKDDFVLSSNNYIVSVWLLPLSYVTTDCDCRLLVVLTTLISSVIGADQMPPW